MPSFILVRFRQRHVGRTNETLSSVVCLRDRVDVCSQRDPTEAYAMLAGVINPLSEEAQHVLVLLSRRILCDSTEHDFEVTRELARFVIKRFGREEYASVSDVLEVCDVK
jgi:hypothetical protein